MSDPSEKAAFGKNAGEEWIQKEHLSEAFGYRALEERIWGQKH